MNATVRQLKEGCGRIGWNIRFKGRPLKNQEVLQTAGVRQNDELHAFPPSTAKPSAEYQAKRRLHLGVTKRSTAHRDLHRETQSVIMSEHKRTREDLAKKTDEQTEVLTGKLQSIKATQGDQVAKGDEIHAWMFGMEALGQRDFQADEERLKELDRQHALRAQERKELKQKMSKDNREKKAEEKKKAKEEEKKKAAEAKAQRGREIKETERVLKENKTFIERLQLQLRNQRPEEGAGVCSGGPKKAERKATRCAPRPPATAEKQATRAASTTEPAAKRIRRDGHEAQQAPQLEAREYKKGEEVKIKSSSGNKEFDGRVLGKAEAGDYRVFVEARNKEVRISGLRLSHM